VICEHETPCGDEDANFSLVSSFESGTSRYDPAPELIKDRAKGMAFIVVEDLQRRVVYTCSAFLISKTHLLSNRHCLYGPDPVKNATPGRVRVWLRANTVDAKSPPTIQNASVKFPKSLLEAGLADVAILELEPIPTGAIALPLDINSNALGDLAVLQFPRNEPLVINSDAQCTGRGTERMFSEDSSIRYLTHGCDTLGGSSGSPILKRDLSSVVAIHYYGFQPGKEGLNRAFLISDIIAELKAKKPDLAQLLQVQ
jgi:hypothetical protein